MGIQRMELVMKKLVNSLLSILFPCIFVQLLFYKSSHLSIIAIGIILYSITIIGLVLFYKFQLSNVWIMPLGFAIPVPICYIQDTLNNSEWLTYLNTSLVTIYYSIPFILISIIIATIFTTHKNKLEGKSSICKRFFSGKLTWQEVKHGVIRKKPQIFSVGILVIALLAITVIFAISLNREQIVRRDIMQKIDQFAEQENCVFKLSEVTNFKWDKVAYFEYPVGESEISRELGATYQGGTDLLEGFIFAYKGKVVHEDVVSIAPGFYDNARLVFHGGSLIVLSQDEAVFEGTKIHDTLYEMKLVLHPDRNKTIV